MLGQNEARPVLEAADLGKVKSANTTSKGQRQRGEEVEEEKSRDVWSDWTRGGQIRESEAEERPAVSSKRL